VGGTLGTPVVGFTVGSAIVIAVYKLETALAFCTLLHYYANIIKVKVKTYLWWE